MENEKTMKKRLVSADGLFIGEALICGYPYFAFSAFGFSADFAIDRETGVKGDEMDGPPYVQSEPDILAEEGRFSTINAMMGSVFQRLNEKGPFGPFSFT